MSVSVSVMASEDLFDRLLSDDLLLMVFDFIPILKLCECRRVCKRFHKLIDYKLKSRSSVAVAIDEDEQSEQEYDSRLDCSDGKHVLTTNDCIYKCCRPIRDGSRTLYVLSPQLLNGLFTVCPNVKTLSLKYTIFDQNVWQYFRESCPSSIQHLDLSQSQGLIDEVIRFIVAVCGPNLTHILLNDSDISESTLQYLFENCPKLEIVDISTNVRVTGQCFRVIPESMQRLSLNNCWNITAEAIGSLVRRTGDSLKRLELNTEFIRKETLSEICDHLRLLTHLDIDCTNVDKKYLQKLANFRHLQELTLSLPQINFDNILIEITKNNPKLTKLSTDGAVVTDYAILHFPDYCPKLESLSISSSEVVVNKKITDSSCEPLSKLKKLRDLDLQYTKIGDKLSEVIANCADIENIEIDGCKQISDTFIEKAIEIQSQRPNTCLTLFARHTKLNECDIQIDNLQLILE